MRAHFVLAHPETNSFNAQLVRSGVEVLEAAGWTATVSDLYAMGDLSPCERSQLSPGAGLIRHRFRCSDSTQRHASENGTLQRMSSKNWGAWIGPTCWSCSTQCGGICRPPCSKGLVRVAS